MNFKNKSLRETICIITESHLKKFKTMVFGQNLLGVGQVDKTLPKHLKEKDGIIDLPMADVAGGGIVTGAALLKNSGLFILLDTKDTIGLI